MNTPRKDKRLANLIALCLESDGGRGIWKCIDENMELFQLIKDNLSDNLDSSSKNWIPAISPFEGWLLSHAAFFNDIVNALDLVIPASCSCPWIKKIDRKESCYKDNFIHKGKYINEKNIDDARLCDVLHICYEGFHACGIWKRIDENRELLQNIKSYKPEFLYKFPSVEKIFENQDIFFCNIIKALSLRKSVWRRGIQLNNDWLEYLKMVEK